MKIKVDAEGKQAIESLCDLALRQGGLQNMQGVQQVLGSVEIIQEDDGK